MLMLLKLIYFLYEFLVANWFCCGLLIIYPIKYFFAGIALETLAGVVSLASSKIEYSLVSWITPHPWLFMNCCVWWILFFLIWIDMLSWQIDTLKNDISKLFDGIEKYGMHFMALLLSRNYILSNKYSEYIRISNSMTFDNGLEGLESIHHLIMVWLFLCNCVGKSIIIILLVAWFFFALFLKVECDVTNDLKWEISFILLKFVLVSWYWFFAA